ncbi:hypothetical protein COJE103337_10495 [Corynebacterium jeikeium]|uniref:hypothetical protein n=1 Tax=Corynebacterium jeikeium TaxID=38289 RepID=UPI0001B71986|nr:hypothetical protein [Corynebacterium jeikeium]EEW17034.1 hypothetical protein HMPREF0297_0639 [Corynebacterium jeikeium ATCC 43734]WCZ53265.1 hypothetical protein CJEIK_03720 [Corynebacterium jeikeium]SUY81424.1 Uncharacterised protein [Corynebacterium jeikeium]
MPADLLNKAEQLLITETEATHSVRNIMLTNKPRGDDTVEIVTSKGSTVALTWERERAKGARQSYADNIDPKLATLLRHPAFLEIRSLVSWYIAITIQDPASTVEQLWTVSCMPSTNRTRTEHRLLTLSCGNLETLFVVASRSEDFENDPDAFVTVRINTALLEDSGRFESPHGFWAVYDDTPYRGERILSFDFSLGGLLAIIDGDLEFPHLDVMLQEAFKLNTRLMRRGSTMYSRFHNKRLADLLIAEAVTWE